MTFLSEPMPLEDFPHNCLRTSSSLVPTVFSSPRLIFALIIHCASHKKNRRENPTATTVYTLWLRQECDYLHSHMKYIDLDYINSFNRINQPKILSQAQSSIKASANTFCCDKRKLNSPRQQKINNHSTRGGVPPLELINSHKVATAATRDRRENNHFSIVETFPDIGSNMFEAWFVLIFGLICSCNAASNREAYLLSTERYV